MPSIEIKEILRSEKRTQYLSTLELESVPAINSKIILDETPESFIFQVVDVHQAEVNGKGYVDVFVERISTISEYYANGLF